MGTILIVKKRRIESGLLLNQQDFLFQNYNLYCKKKTTTHNQRLEQLLGETWRYVNVIYYYQYSHGGTQFQETVN